MAISHKYTRLITVSGDRYRWRLGRLHDRSPITVIVQRGNDPGSVLVADLGRLWFDLWLSMNDPGPKPGNPKPVLPNEVADCIQNALASGWRPGKP